MGFCRQECWSRLPCPPPGDLPDSGIEPMSPTLACGFFTTEPPGRSYTLSFFLCICAIARASQVVQWLKKEEEEEEEERKFTCQCRICESYPWVRKIPWRRKWQATPAFLPGKFHGQRSLAGYSHGVTRSRIHTSTCSSQGNCDVFLYFLKTLTHTAQQGWSIY